MMHRFYSYIDPRAGSSEGTEFLTGQIRARHVFIIFRIEQFILKLRSLINNKKSLVYMNSYFELIQEFLNFDRQRTDSLLLQDF